ncbi:MAG: hypothetical protein H0U23_16670 [Blastocatellia bacterium]|nr:hypothetical protein [Blastocatellia bacterium]
MTVPLILLESAGSNQLARLLETLGVIFEPCSSVEEALADPDRSEGGNRALILSEEHLVAASLLARDRRLSLVQLFSGYARVLVYPLSGRVDAIEALSEWINGEIEIFSLHGSENDYSVSRLIAAGPFAGLEFGPANPNSDFALGIAKSAYPVETIVCIGKLDFFTRIDFPASQLFFCCSNAVFDVGAEVRRNLEAAAHFSGLVPLIVFLRHCGIASWRTPALMANLLIDDPDLTAKYGFLEPKRLARCVDDLGCAVSIGFIPWNFKRTSSAVVEMFRDRWPLLSLCVHGCDHVKDEFCSTRVSTSQHLISLARERMKQFSLRTGLKYDKVMVFPRGEFSGSAMQALRQSTLLGGVNTQLYDNQSGRGVTAGELLRPAITAYSGFPLFIRRPADEPIANFALDLLLGKPCLVGMHHDFFRDGPESFISLVNSLNSLDPSLVWTNLESIICQTYAVRPTSNGGTEVRLFSPWTSLASERTRGEIRFSKHEPLANREFRAMVNDQDAVSARQGDDVLFSAKIESSGTTVVRTAVSSAVDQPVPSYPMPYRVKVAARRHFSRIRDNHEAGPAWLRDIWKWARRPARKERSAAHEEVS